MPLTTQVRAVEADLASLRAQKAEAIAERDAAKKTVAEMDKVDRESDEFKAAVEAADTVRAIQAQIDEKQQTLVDLLKMNGGDAPDPIPSNGKPLGWDPLAIVNSDTYKRVAQDPAIRVDGARVGNHVLGEVMSREVLARQVRAESPEPGHSFGSSDVAGLIQPDRRGLVPPSYRQLTLLDLIPSGTTGSNLIEYVQVTQRASGADIQEEGERKAESTLAFEDAEAPIKTIAGWVKVPKQTLADAMGLRTFIDTELRFDALQKLEAQIVAGNGQGKNMRGLLNTPGVLAPDVSAYTEKVDKIHRGITVLYLANYVPDAVVVNPEDWEEIRLSRDKAGGQAGTGGYLFGLPAFAGFQSIWDLPKVVSTAIPQGKALVGAFQRGGAVIMYRTGVTVAVSDADGEDFTHNRVTVLAELRAGLPVFRPDAFAVVDLEGGS